MHFTNKRSDYDEVLAFKAAAIADGWQCQATYNTESIDRAATLNREGFHLKIIARDNTAKLGSKHAYHLDLSMWGPDGLAILPPETYDWQKIQAAVRSCNYCRAQDVDTFRVSFAGRCCAQCLPKQRAIHERPGWNC